VIKDDHMPPEPETHRGSWLIYATTVVLPVLYVLSWGPTVSLAANYPTICKRVEAAYGPVSWLDENTSLATPLDWYWWRFEALRPKCLRLDCYHTNYIPYEVVAANEQYWTPRSLRDQPPAWHVVVGRSLGAGD
jgi:hypothetical protein